MLLIPICSKIFEKIIFSSLLKYLEDNKLLNCNHVRIIFSHLHTKFTNCLTPIPHLKGDVFYLDIPKAFDRVWHDGLLYKLKVLGIYCRYYNLIQSFLDNKHQVVLNGQSSKWSLVEAGLPQGTILGPLLFLVYINDLPQGLRCNAKLFADDTSLFLTTTSLAISSIKS